MFIPNKISTLKILAIRKLKYKIYLNFDFKNFLRSFLFFKRQCFKVPGNISYLNFEKHQLLEKYPFSYCTTQLFTYVDHLYLIISLCSNSCISLQLLQLYNTNQPLKSYKMLMSIWSCYWDWEIYLWRSIGKGVLFKMFDVKVQVQNVPELWRQTLWKVLLIP